MMALVECSIAAAIPLLVESCLFVCARACGLVCVATLLGKCLHNLLLLLLSCALLLVLQSIQQMNHEQLLQRDGGDGSHGSFSIGGPGGLSSVGVSHHSSGGISPSTVTPATTAGSLPGAHQSYSTTGSSSLAGGGMAARSEGSFMAAATAGGALELGSTIGTHASWAGSVGGSMGGSMGGSFSAGGGIMGRSFVARQVRRVVEDVGGGREGAGRGVFLDGMVNRRRPPTHTPLGW